MVAGDDSEFDIRSHALRQCAEDTTSLGLGAAFFASPSDLGQDLLDKPIYAPAVLMYANGPRPEEMLGLKHEHLDLDASAVSCGSRRRDATRPSSTS